MPCFATSRFTPSSFSSSPGNSEPATPITKYSAKARGQLPNSNQMFYDASPQAVHQKRTELRWHGACATVSEQSCGPALVFARYLDGMPRQGCGAEVAHVISIVVAPAGKFACVRADRYKVG